jgi:allantoicase
VKHYEYGVRCVGDDAPRFKTTIYQDARDYADGWNTQLRSNKRAEVVVRTVEVSPWTVHLHERILAKRKG